MSAVVIQLADAALTALNAATFSQSFTATRAYVPVYGKQDENADDLATLRVTVVPTGITSTTLDRSPRHLFDHVIDIGVQKRIAAGTASPADFNAECDPLMLLAQEICDLFNGKPITYASTERATCISAANDPIFWPPHLFEQRVFTSRISLKFRLGR